MKNKIIIRLIDDDEPIEIDNFDNEEIEDLLYELNGHFVRIYDFIFRTDQIKFITFWSEKNEK